MKALRVKTNYNKKKDIKKVNYLANSKRVNTTKLFK